MVHDYVPEMIKIINTMPPGAVCATVGLCDSSSAGVATEVKRSAGAHQTAAYRRLLETYAPGHATQSSTVGSWGMPSNGDACQMCQFVVQYAKVGGAGSLVLGGRRRMGCVLPWGRRGPSGRMAGARPSRANGVLGV